MTWKSTAILGLVWVLVGPEHAPLAKYLEPQTKKPELPAVFDAMYNLDYPEALTLARHAVAAVPNDPAAHRALAEVLWLQMLFVRGAASVDYYMNDVTETQFALPKPPPEMAAEFARALDRATALGDAAARARPRDPQALYDMGAAWAQRAAYVGSVEGSVTRAFVAAKRAYDAHEAVLDRAPERVEANFVVGTYRYAVSTLGVAPRMFAYLAGFGGGRERGIAMIATASRGGLSQADALFALALIYSREGRHAEALAHMRELQRLYPRNRLLVLEEGAALIRAGHADTADRVLTAGLARLDTDPRARTPGERAFWLYKRGLARLNWNHPADAAADLNAALAADPVGWVRGRIHVELGKLADLAGERARAVKEYRDAAALCDRHNDPICVAEARRFGKKAFAFALK